MSVPRSEFETFPSRSERDRFFPIFQGLQGVQFEGYDSLRINVHRALGQPDNRWLFSPLTYTAMRIASEHSWIVNRDGQWSLDTSRHYNQQDFDTLDRLLEGASQVTLENRHSKITISTVQQSGGAEGYLVNYEYDQNPAQNMTWSIGKDGTVGIKANQVIRAIIPTLGLEIPIIADGETWLRVDPRQSNQFIRQLRYAIVNTSQTSTRK